MCASGGNWRTLKAYAIDVWRIPIDHFDPHAASRKALERGRYPARPLNEILVAASTFPRGQLKKRLYAEGIKARRCELCGQGEFWRGRRAVADPRSHQRGSRRQSAREPPDRVPELRGDAGDPLRPERQPPATVRDVRERVHPRRRQAAPLLDIGAVPCRRAEFAPRMSSAGSRAAALRAARRRGGGDQLVGGRAQIRRLRQRDTEVGAGLRARAGVSRAGRGGGRRGPRPSRAGPGRGGRRPASGRSAGGWRRRRGPRCPRA